ncbi:MAG: hypothetical protein R2799_04465 [Crocinitomicaceae bacterium]|nr:hypothetical protein [Crocinitomicaceae bacterium]
MKEKIQYSQLANLFRYPKEDYLTRVNDCANMLKEKYPEAYKELLPFVDVVNQKELFEIEEIFGRTFHIQAICYLDIGYVLFAEDYKRGEFLVNMKEEQRKANNDCGEELADNLPNVLKLMSILEDQEFLEELSSRIIAPALEKMLEEFDVSRMQLKTKIMKKKQKVIIQENLENKNIFQHAIAATLLVIQKDFKVEKYEGREVKPDVLSSFLPNCSTCSVHEDEKKASTEKINA